MPMLSGFFGVFEDEKTQDIPRIIKGVFEQLGGFEPSAQRISHSALFAARETDKKSPGAGLKVEMT